MKTVLDPYLRLSLMMRVIGEKLMAKQNIYDNDMFFENIKNIRSNEVNFNDFIETLILHAMLPGGGKEKVY